MPLHARSQTAARTQFQRHAEQSMNGISRALLIPILVRSELQVGRGAGSGGRREAGNSNFVRQALLPVMPDRDDFGFTVRLNADALAVDGSAAAASVCSGALALADSGVPTTGLVAAVTVGLVEQPQQDQAQGEVPSAPCRRLLTAAEWRLLTGLSLPMPAATTLHRQGCFNMIAHWFASHTASARSLLTAVQRPRTSSLRSVY